MKTKEVLQPENGKANRFKMELSTFSTAILLALVVVVLIPMFGAFFLSIQVENDVRQLFRLGGRPAAKPFGYNQLETLPEPVQAYFKHVLRQGQVPVMSLRLNQKGQLKTDLKKGWISINSEQYITTSNPGFVWKGDAYMFSARESYLKGHGKFGIFLFSSYRLQKAEGPSYDQAALLRWLSENVFYPTNLLPRDNLLWLPIDDRSAQLLFRYQDVLLTYNVFFNDKNEISRMETNRITSNGKREKWVVSLSNYQWRNGMRIPMDLQAGWHLKEGYAPYMKLSIINIEYNKPEPF